MLDLKVVKETIERDGEARFHIISSKSGLTTKCRMWHHDGYVVGSASGGGYDKAGTALGEAVMKLWPEELKTLPLPERRRNGSVESGLYGLNETKDGKRYLDGACGLRCMLAVLEALGFKVEEHQTGRLSALIIARKG